MGRQSFFRAICELYSNLCNGVSVEDYDCHFRKPRNSLSRHLGPTAVGVCVWYCLCHCIPPCRPICDDHHKHHGSSRMWFIYLISKCLFLCWNSGITAHAATLIVLLVSGGLACKHFPRTLCCYIYCCHFGILRSIKTVKYLFWSNSTLNKNVV